MKGEKYDILHSHQIPPHLTFARPRAKLKFTFPKTPRLQPHQICILELQAKEHSRTSVVQVQQLQAQFRP